MPPLQKLPPTGPIICPRDLEPGDLVFIELSECRKLTWLKHIDLGPAIEPKNFGLTQWACEMEIPENYQENTPVNMDTGQTNGQELSVQREPEVLTVGQRAILDEYLNHRKKVGVPKFRQVKAVELPRTRPKKQKPEPYPLDTLLEDITACDKKICDMEKNKQVTYEQLQKRRSERNPKAPLVSLDSNNIPICGFSHQVQPESVIVEKALEKMNHLSVADEIKLQSLLKEKDYMEMLNHNVELYIKNLSKGDGGSDTTEIASHDWFHNIL